MRLDCFILLILVALGVGIGVYGFLIAPSNEWFMPEEVIIHEGVVDELNSIYNDYQEYIRCFTGHRDGDAAVVTGVFIPSNVYSTDELVSSSNCRSRTDWFLGRTVLGSVHSHPNGECQASARDTYNFGRNGDMIMGIQCKEDRFVFYSPSHPFEGIPYEVVP